ncbi:uncharacterized protein LOC108152952 isoform X1 [Drosophila miranda]|uniref:uncharacterized protein LOC108152952 isoform X1 n=1 Tax=Drosophila miranda TaxID=7229 RepID=UPI00143F1BD1|nr:uncharacterized protein LOC108152952 isoform X1 [Drosophila miranda]
MTDAFLLGLLVFSAAVAVLLEPLLATRDFEIRWRTINCTAIDPATTAAFHCLIVELPKRQGNFLNTRLLLNRPVPKMWVEMSVGQVGGTGTVQNLMKVRVDACHLVGFRSKNRILNAVLGKLLQSGNYPKACPLLGVSSKMDLFHLILNCIDLGIDLYSVYVISHSLCVHKSSKQPRIYQKHTQGNYLKARDKQDIIVYGMSIYMSVFINTSNAY